MIINLIHLKKKIKPREVLKISEKHCKRCDKTKDVADFNKNKRSKDLYSFYCTSCYNEISAKDYQRRKQKQFNRIVK